MSLITRGFGDEIGEIQMIEELSLEIEDTPLELELKEINLNLELKEDILEVEVQDGEDITILYEV